MALKNESKGQKSLQLAYSEQLFIIIYGHLRHTFLKLENATSHAGFGIQGFLGRSKERIRKGEYLRAYRVVNGGDIHVPALRCIYNIMKTCSEQAS